MTGKHDAGGRERRRFWRASFASKARLLAGDGGHIVQLHDISLKGALVETVSPDVLKVGESCQLQLDLSIGARIALWGTVAHVQGTNAGIRCDSIDLDSITHLRRLVELNAGDPSVLERDLASLIA